MDILVHARWCEVLGREALTRSFFRALEGAVGRLSASISGEVSDDDARTLALLTTTRLLFLAFLEAKGWLNGDHGFIRRTWDECMAEKGGYHRRVLLPLCFGTLNTPRSRRARAARVFGRIPFLNGGLFNRTALERRHPHALFPDAALGPLVCDLLGKWRFTVRENSACDGEAAIDPEMLGRAFECLMSSRERRTSGTFYTPSELVARVTEAALDAACDIPGLAGKLGALRRGELGRDEARELGGKLRSLTLLDPACGSGAFLVHALEELARLRSLCGDPLETGALRRDILARQLFGVDREPTAVWLCELRLWLAVVVETTESDPLNVPPLPNLDAQVRVGDALAGDAFVDGVASSAAPALAGLRSRYSRASGPRKKAIARQLTRAERNAAIAALDHRIESAASERKELMSFLRGRDLFGSRIVADSRTRERLAELKARVRGLRSERRSVVDGAAVAFDFAAQFADIGARGGFDIVTGNPPWVRLHNIPAATRSRLRSRFAVFRDAGWRAGAAAAGAGIGFAAQVDLAALFVERSLSLVRTDGVLSLLVPAKLWRSLAGGGLRDLLLRETRITDLEDWSEARATFDAAVYPSLIVARRTANTPGTPERDDSGTSVRVVEHHRDSVLDWQVPQPTLAYDTTRGAPWLWLPAEPRDGFEEVRRLGIPLAEREWLRPRLGVKCGLNEAFLVPADPDRRHAAAAGRSASVEQELLRPVLRGESVMPWRIEPTGERLIFPHDSSLRPLRALPPLARAWLGHWRAQLLARTDLRGAAPWWSLFRVEGADARKPRVVWADIAKSPRAAVLPAGDTSVPLNSCYVVLATSIDEAHALAVWLNSPLSAAWLTAMAEPARGGFRRMLGWTMALLPLPRRWDDAVSTLAPIGVRAASGVIPASDELLDATLHALGAAPTRLEPLLTWGHR